MNAEVSRNRLSFSCLLILFLQLFEAVEYYHALGIYYDDMAVKLTSFPPHPPNLSPLLKKAPDAVPPMDELEQFHKDLKLAKETPIHFLHRSSYHHWTLIDCELSHHV